MERSDRKRNCPDKHHTAEGTKVDNLIEEFEKIENPGVPQLSSFLISFLKATNNLNARIAEVEEDIQELRDQNALQEKRLSILEEKVTDVEVDQRILKSDTEKSLETINKRLSRIDQRLDQSSGQINYSQQLVMDKDIILKGFTAKPDVEAVIAKFSTIFNLNANKISEYYYVSYNKHDNNDRTKIEETKHFVVISFKSKSTKVNVFKQKTEDGPLLQNQLHENLHPTKNPTISIANKLSKFNLYTQRVLYNAVANNTIHEYRFHNCIFQIKANPTGNWKRVDTYGLVQDISNMPKKPTKSAERVLTSE